MMSAFSFARLLCIPAGIGTQEDLDTAHNFIICPSGASCSWVNRVNEESQEIGFILRRAEFSLEFCWFLGIVL